LRRLVRRQRRVRLVEEHDAGVACERPRDLRALLHREPEPVEDAVAVPFDPQLGEQRVVAVAEPGPLPTTILEPRVHCLLDRQVREQLGPLVDDGDAVRAVVVRPRAAVDEDLALVARDLAGEDLHHRALARPVGSGDTEDLARCRVEVEAVQRDRVAVVLAHAAHRHTRGRRTHVRPCWRLVSRSITTAPTVTVPSRICDANGPAAMRATPLKSTARRSAPIIVPTALPLPPE